MFISSVQHFLCHRCVWIAFNYIVLTNNYFVSIRLIIWLTLCESSCGEWMNDHFQGIVGEIFNFEFKDIYQKLLNGTPLIITVMMLQISKKWVKNFEVKDFAFNFCFNFFEFLRKVFLVLVKSYRVRTNEIRIADTRLNQHVQIITNEFFLRITVQLKSVFGQHFVGLCKKHFSLRIRTCWSNRTIYYLFNDTNITFKVI